MNYIDSCIFRKSSTRNQLQLAPLGLVVKQHPGQPQYMGFNLGKEGAQGVHTAGPVAAATGQEENFAELSALTKAAMSMGARPRKAFALVTLPNIFQAVPLLFMHSFDAVRISQSRYDSGVFSLSLVFFGYTRRDINPTIDAAAALMISTVYVVVVGC